MEPLTSKDTATLAEALATYATLRLWGIFSSYRREGQDGHVLWEQDFAAWKGDYLREIAALKSLAAKLGIGTDCIEALDEAYSVMQSAGRLRDLSERQMQRRMKKWQTILSGRLRSGTDA